MSEPLWQPTASAAQSTNLARFSAAAAKACGEPLTSYEALHAFSTEEPGAFWHLIWTHCGVKGDPGAGPYLVDRERMPGAKFFPNGRLNFAENLLAGAGAVAGTDDALVFRGEDKVQRRMSWDELRHQAAQLQTLLRRAGVTAGDRVAAMLPNMPEGVIGMLATARSARCGRRARRTSASRACSTASARSSRKC